MAKKEDMTKTKTSTGSSSDISRSEMSRKTGEELTKLLTDTRAHLREERFAKAGARPKDPNSLRTLRKTVARVLTEQHARTLRAD